MFEHLDDPLLEFVERHVIPPLDYKRYAKEEQASHKARGKAHNPFWLRRPNDHLDDFSANIDYMHPSGDQLNASASLHIVEDKVEVLIIPREKSAQAVLVFSDLYCRDSLEQAMSIAQQVGVHSQAS